MLLGITELLNAQTVHNKLTPEQYHSISIGVSFGRFSNEIIHGKESNDPWNIFISTFDELGRERFDQSFGMFTFGYFFTKIKRRSIVTFRLRGSLGYLNETARSTGISKDHTLATINPNIRYDLKWLGIGLGMHIGMNAYALPQIKHDKEDVPETGLGHLTVLPQAHFRLGPKRFLFFEYNFADQFPNAMPAITHQFAIGSAFGVRNGFYIKYGGVSGSTDIEDTTGEYQPSSFLAAYVPINEKLVFEPYVGFGTHKNVYLVGFHYRFRNDQ